MFIEALERLIIIDWLEKKKKTVWDKNLQETSSRPIVMNKSRKNWVFNILSLKLSILYFAVSVIETLYFVTLHNFNSTLSLEISQALPGLQEN